MTRHLLAMVALILVLGACGSEDDQVRDRLREIDPSITDEMADCIIDELDARGISLSDSAANDEQISTAAQQALIECLTTGLESSESQTPEELPDLYGSDPALDGLWDACAAGEGAACDDLYFQSPIGSEYEEFGLTCGRRTESPPVLCEELLDPEPAEEAEA